MKVLCIAADNNIAFTRMRIYETDSPMQTKLNGIDMVWMGTYDDEKKFTLLHPAALHSSAVIGATWEWLGSHGETALFIEVDE